MHTKAAHGADAQARVAALEACFREVAAMRMAGVPVLRPGLRVQAVGLAAWGDDAAVLSGVLVTPWFMSLVRLPLRPASADVSGAWLAVGRKATRSLGGVQFEFIGSHEPGLGAFETSSLFSPMFHFADHDAALATAWEVLRQLRAGPAALAPEPVPSRRGFLFGRAPTGAQP
jgi:[NiFe] hydrogenase assembly HybE family chaperone